MNRIYRKVWNKELGQLVVASEFAKSDSTGVVQGEGGAAPLTRSMLAVVFASLFAVAGYGPAAFAQEWTVTDGATVGFQGDSNINVSVTPDGDDAAVEISLDPNLVVDSVTAGQTRLDSGGVAVGSVVLGSTGLTLGTSGISVTTAGIDAGNTVITNVANGVVNSDAVNFGQLQGVESSAQAAATAASVAQSTADNALTAAGNAQTTADAAVAAAGAGWDVSADSGSTANIGSGGSVAFSGDSNISVAQSGGDNAGAIKITLNPDLNVTSVTAGDTTVNNDGLTITGGPSVTASGLDAGGTKLTGLANGTVSADSTDAITGQQLHNVLFEGGSAFGVRYFRANSTADDAVAAGVEAVAIGPNTRAEGASSFAAGDGAATSATAEGSIALGQGAVSGTEGGAVPDGDGSIAIGRDSQASGNRTIALGDGANIDSEYIEDGTALGAGATVSGNFSTGGTAVGANAMASAGNATALGTEAQASGSGSIAVGQAEATAGNSIAAGTGAYAATGDSIALGTGAGVGTEGLPGGDRTDHIAIGTAAGQNVQGNQSTAIGYGAGQGVVGDGNIALGVEAGRGLEGNNNISIGVNANDGAGGRAQAIAIGDGTAAGSDSVALGSGATAVGSETVAFGKDAIAGANGVALGAHAEAQGSNIALGRNSAARESDVAGVGYLTGEAVPGSAVSVGNSNPGEAFQRRITNVSDGAQRYDAVNVGQLQSAQQSVANLVGGNVTVESNGSFGGYVIELQDQNGVSHQYATVAEAINAVSSGDISVLPGDAVIYNPNGTVTVARGVVGTDAVNVEQLNEAIAESGVKYFSANTTVDANRGNDGATATDAMAIGPAAVASGTSSLAVGHAARVNAGAHNGVAIGHDVSARAENATVLGNRSHTYDAGGVAIGQQAVSRGQNSIVMGTGAEADPKSGQTVDNAIVIGTDAEATADDGIAVGQSALASEDRAVAQGYDAHAMAVDSQAFGTRARTTGVNSQASGTDAHASGVNAIASGTNARGYANDGIAMGTGAISGFVVDIPGDAPRNHGSIAIGDTSRADDLNAMALGVEAQARAGSATAIGDSAVATQDAEDGLAVGSSARVTAQNASAFGRGAEAVAEDALAVGSGARAAGQSASAVGHGAEASAMNASAFGQGARALHQGSVALGSGAETAAAVGTASYTVDRNTYNFAGTTPVATVSVGTLGQERTITNVAAGRISAQSTDAINGSQLYSTNQAVDALADDLDTAGQSVAAALGGTSSYNPETHTVTAGLSVQGNNYTNVQDALTYVGQGWNVSVGGETGSANVAPGGQVDFSNQDGNINIARSGTDLTFNLDDDLAIGNSITVGDTVIDGDSVTTTNLTVEGETRLGDNFVVHNNGNVTYNGAEIATQDDGLSFAGNTGGNISKTLGDNTPLTISGGLGASEASTGANLRVDSDGNQLNLVMARDLTDLDSITINNGGPVIGSDGINMGDNQITNLAAGTSDDHAVNLGQLRDVEEVANRGWDVGVNSEATGANVAPGGSVDFSNTDENIVIARDGTDLTFDLADDLEIGNSITFVDGDTVIDGDSITTNNLTVEGDTRLGDHFTVNDGGVYYDGDITEGNHIVNKTYVDGEIDALANTPLTFVGDAGDDVDRLLGETVNLVGGATDETALTDGNIGVVANGNDTLEIKLNKDINLGADGSVAIGDAELDNEGLVVTDGGNSTEVGAGTINVTDAAGTTVIGGNQVSVGGDNPIVISGDTGTIGGLTNLTFDPDNITSGQAATEDQLGSVYEVANAGWDVSAQGANATNVGVNSPTGNSVDLNNADGNIVVTKADDSNDVTFDLAENIDLGENGSLTTGNTVVNNDGVAVEDEDGNVTTVAAGGTTTTDGAGNSTAVGAGTVTVTDAAGETVIGGSHVSVGGDNPILISGDTGTIGGLTNITFDPNATYTGGIAATQEQLSQVNNDLTSAGLDFVGDDGQVVHRDLGEQLSVTGGATGTLSEGNIGVTRNADEDGLIIELADNIELTEDGSLAIGDGTDGSTLDADGLAVVDGDNSTTVEAGTIAVTDDGGTTTIGGNQISVGGDNPLVISGDTGTIGGLTNLTFDPDNIVSGQAATEDQLGQVYDVANAGWDVSAQGANATNVGVNSPTGNSVDLNNADGNIVVTKADDSNDVTFDLADDITVDSVTAGDSVLDTDGLAVTDANGNVTTVAADGTTTTDGAGNSTAVGAGTVAVTDAGGTTTIGGTQVVVGGTSPITIDGNAGTIGGLSNQTIDYPGFADGSGRAATEEQLDLVNQTASAGWNLTGSGDDQVNIGPNGSVDFQGDQNITVAQTGEDQDGVIEITLNRDLDVDSVTAGDTFIDTTGVAIGTDVHLGNTGLVINGGPSVTVTGINAGNMVITNVAPGEISATSTDAINGSQLHGMGDSIVNVIGGNAELNPDGTITTSDIGGTGHDNIDDAIRAANDAANAGWTATDADGNAANIGPNGSVAFTGDGNISVAQTGEDNNGQVEITLNRDLDVDSITAGNTVIDTDGVQVGDNVHLGDTGLVIEGGPSVTTDGIDAGGSTLTNVAAGVNDTDAVNVGQLNQVAGDVNDLGDRMDVVEGDVADLQAGATGPFQVSQEAPLVPPTPTGANSAAGGSGADASGDNSTALGNQAVASGDNSAAVGQGAQATHDNSVALGQGSATTVGAQSGYDAAYVGSSDSAGEVNVGNRTITGVAPGVAGTDAVNVNQLNAGVNHAVVTANEYTDQRVNQVQSDVWHLHGRVDDLEKSINSGVATAMAMRQAPYVAGATTYFAGFGAYKDQGALGVSMRRTADNGRWSLEGGFSANRDGAGGYIGVSGVLGSK